MRLLGPDNLLLTAQSFGDLARLYQAQGGFKEAEEMYQQSLAGREKITETRSRLCYGQSTWSGRSLSPSAKTRGSGSDA
ncbi:hypothetical protein BJX99DRAFT_222434 [Aspergillus californicus]